VNEISESQRAQAIWKTLAHRHPEASLNIADLHPTLHFVGHYQEPPLTLNINLTASDVDVLIAFDPSSGQWAVTAMQPAKPGARSDAEQADRDCDYGASHREYVVSKRREQGAHDAAKQVDEEFQKSRQRAARFADEEARDRARNRACTILRNHRQVQKLISDSRRASANTTSVDPRFGSKVPFNRQGEEQFTKVPTSDHRASMTNHVNSCAYDGCRSVWNGPWGSFIGGARGGTHFDLTECPHGKQMNQVIGWNYDNPAC